MASKDKKMIYIHPAPVRVWHWVNAAGFLVLILTGVQIRFADMFDFMSLKEAVTIHNWVGFVVIADYFLWLVYYLGTGKIKIYFPDLKTFVPKAIAQAKYYGFGIFKGDHNPHVMTPTNKFNAMQQQAYLSLMLLLLPLQMISGVLLWDVDKFQSVINMVGGLQMLDSLHVLLFYFFCSFMLVHAYLASLGQTPTAHYKAMFTGWEEEH